MQGQATDDAHEQLQSGSRQPAAGDAEWHQSFDLERQRYYYWRLSPEVTIGKHCVHVQIKVDRSFGAIK